MIKAKINKVFSLDKSVSVVIPNIEIGDRYYDIFCPT